MWHDFSHTALTGLNAAAHNLSIISNNIANVNTVGFKAVVANFYDLANASGNIAGMGVAIGENTHSFVGGSVVPTGNATNLQIGGKGFFVLKDQAGQVLYSRAGNFNLNSDGYMVTAQGVKLQGYSGDVKSGTLEDLKIDRSPTPPEATANAIMNGNLDKTETTPYVQMSTVFDKRGESHLVQTEFAYNATDDEWTVTYTVDNDIPNQVTSTITFDDSSQIATGTSFDLTVDDGTVTFDFTKITGYGGQSLSWPVSTTDGYPAGNYSRISFEKDGQLFAHYSNGHAKLVGTVALADFLNYGGLQKAGSSNWLATAEAGTVTNGAPGSFGFSELGVGVLEGSNVNLSGELVQMISAQRDYQSNAQVIKTGKTLDQAILNL